MANKKPAISILVTSITGIVIALLCGATIYFSFTHQGGGRSKGFDGQNYVETIWQEFGTPVPYLIRKQERSSARNMELHETVEFQPGGLCLNLAILAAIYGGLAGLCWIAYRWQSILLLLLAWLGIAAILSQAIVGVLFALYMT